jgi:hypothetical protein
MQKISIYLTMSLVVVGVILGMGIGYSFTPQYSLSMYDKSTKYTFNIAKFFSKEADKLISFKD